MGRRVERLWTSVRRVLFTQATGAGLREEFLDHGLSGWPDHRVLELLLFYAIPQGDVNPLAHRLVDHFGSLAGGVPRYL